MSASRDHVRTHMEAVLEILRPMREQLDAQGFRAVVTAHDLNGHITLTVEVCTTTVPLPTDEGRSAMFGPFATAFEAWEREFRANPGRFMTDAEMAALDGLPLAERRAAQLEAILNTLSAGRPWQTIGDREVGSS
jgi:hypothetical protein